MQLSVLLPTHRHGLLACSRIAQACSWAGPEVEVIVRDNSGDRQKRALLPQFKRDNCNIIIAEPCDSLTNISEILRLAKGDFIFIIGDDDFCFDHAIAALPDTIAQIGADQSVIGVTGAYAVEFSQRSAVAEYKNLDADDPATRVTGLLSHSGPNVLQYAPVRRELVQRAFGFLRTQPFLFSFHDQVNCLLFVLNGKFVSINRFLYLYDMGPWEHGQSAQERDVSFYKDAGFDPAINKLHWILCAFEGATLIRNADLFPDYPLTQRQAIADRWFAAMFYRFKNDARLTFGSSLAGKADQLCANLLQSRGQMSFSGILSQLCGFMAMSSKINAQRYADFWSAAIDRRASSELAVAARASA
jgi:Glycosyl transferase family 2